MEQAMVEIAVPAAVLAGISTVKHISAVMSRILALIDKHCLWILIHKSYFLGLKPMVMEHWPSALICFPGQGISIIPLNLPSQIIKKLREIPVPCFNSRQFWTFLKSNLLCIADLSIFENIEDRFDFDFIRCEWSKLS